MISALLFVVAVIEDEYGGPKLDKDGKVTRQFMIDLMEHFKNQKKLHRKYAYQVRQSLKYKTVFVIQSCKVEIVYYIFILWLIYHSSQVTVTERG